MLFGSFCVEMGKQRGLLLGKNRKEICGCFKGGERSVGGGELARNCWWLTLR